jgi:non-specific serine/threonine protein kinase
LSAEAHNPNPLQPGTHLADYVITGVLGEGGFGIVYSATDERLGRTIAIKEYLPASIAGRTGDLSVRVRSANNVDAFNNGLQSFMREAKLLAQFSHPALVEVYRVWEQNYTAYIAMRMCVGQTAHVLRRNTTRNMGEDEIKQLLLPVFDAVATLHMKDIIHRDISPDNVMISPNGTATLLDLGAARMVLAGLTQALTTVLKPGYAPIEQYIDDGSLKQGPWTDVYGLAALIYYLATSQPPAQSIARTLRDTLAPLPVSDNSGYSQRFVDAVTAALAVQPGARLQSVAEFLAALGWNERSVSASFAQGVRLVAQQAKPLAMPTPSVALASNPSRLDDPDATVVMPRVKPITLPSSDASSPPAKPPTNKRTWMIAGAALAITAAVGIGIQQWDGKPKHASIATTIEKDKALPVAPPTTPPPANNDAPRAAGASPPASAPPTPQATPSAATKPIVPAPQDVAIVRPTEAEAEAAKLLAAKKKRDEEAAASTQKKREELAATKRADEKRLAEEKLKEQRRFEAIEKKRLEDKEAADRLAAQRRDEQARAEKTRNEVATKAQETAPTASTAMRALVANPNQAVNDLSALALKAYKDGRMQEARGYWSQIANMPEASARSKAQALGNSARTYCTAGDSNSCERLYVQAIRADASFRVSEADAAQRQIGDAYRAARAKTGSGY